VIVSLLVVMGAVVAPSVASAAPTRAAGQCGLPDAVPVWIDFAGSTVGFRSSVFARPGLALAIDVPGQGPSLTSAGAQTVYWEMNLPARVGTPIAPADPASVPGAANTLFDRAVATTGCPTPLIALNEMLAPTAALPLTPENTQYRANLLLLVQTLAARGARPFLLLPSNPNTSSDAADWWRQVAQVADLVREVYLPAPATVAQGPILGNRTIRLKLRAAVQSLMAVGVDVGRVGVMLGFQSAGVYGRAGLQPLSAWLEYVKWSALDAQQVAVDTGLGTVWSWGWGTFSRAGADPDKAAAACVYLWARSSSLCDAALVAPPDFDSSLTEGQISSLPQTAVCSLASGTIPAGELQRLTALTGDPARAFTALLGRLVQRAQIPVGSPETLAAERLLIRVRFRGSRARYLAALASRNVPLTVARGIIADEIARRALYTSVGPVAAWTATQETAALDTAICVQDQLPAVGDVKLANLVPFLKLTRY
jgi:hypothetical protein